MARLLKPAAAAKFAAREVTQLGLATLAAASLVALVATQATAQKNADESPDMVIEAIDICGMILTDVTAAEAELANLGWFVEDSYSISPFSWEISASKIYDDGADAYVFAVIESYPSAEIGYCSFDLQLIAEPVDFDVVVDTYDVVGEVRHDDVGAYGTWESVDDDAVYFVLGTYEDGADYFFVQMTRLGEGTSAGIGGGGK